MSDNPIKRILLVEDDRSLSRLYTTKLEKNNYEVVVAFDGEECLQKIAESKPDMLLLDVIIPKVDGFEVLKRLKSLKDTQDIPVILLTNLGQDEDVQKGKTLGAVNYLIKSEFTPSEIVQKIETLLGIKHEGPTSVGEAQETSPVANEQTP